MNSECRLCGLRKPHVELVITLQTQSETLTFLDLVEYFCRIRIDPDKSLSQSVCKKCKTSLEGFMFFCDSVERHQKSLQRVKSERNNSCIIVKELVKESAPQATEHEDEELAVIEFPMCDPLCDDLNDEILDSPVSEEDSNDTNTLENQISEPVDHPAPVTTSPATPKNIIALRRKTSQSEPNNEMTTMPCSVILDRIENVIYCPTDPEDATESDTDSSDDEEFNQPLKRLRESLTGNTSPSKRMRITSPAKVKQEQTEKIVVLKPISTLSNFKHYHKLFEDEFKTKNNQSNFNLPVPASAKARDGSLTKDFAEKFTHWSMIKMKCVFECKERKKMMTPYDMLLHKRLCHREESENFFKCTDCDVAGFNFCKFFQHMTEKHFKNLRYCCLICSKMFYNFTALFHHYSSNHPDFKAGYICLQDGFIFESFLSLQDHFNTHQTTNSFHRSMRVEDTYLNKSFDRENNCGTCETLSQPSSLFESEVPCINQYDDLNHNDHLYHQKLDQKDDDNANIVA